MPRSYGSYSSERKKDKPYRGAEIALGFLGNIMESKNVQALQYDKLLADKEKDAALQSYRTESLETQRIAAQKPVAIKPGQQYVQYNPETKSYDKMDIAGVSGQPPINWGEWFTKRFKEDFLDDKIVYKDTTGDGEVDRTFVGPDADLMRIYEKGKAAKTPGYENSHPDEVLKYYNTYKGDDAAMLDTIAKYRVDREKYADIYDDYTLMGDIGNDPNVDYAHASGAYKGFLTKYAPKKPIQLSYTDKASINQGLNERADYIGWLAGREFTTTYKTIEGDWWDQTNPNTGDLQISSKRTKSRELSEKERVELEDKVRAIEATLTGYGITFTPFSYDNPRNTAPYLPQE